MYNVCLTVCASVHLSIYVCLFVHLSVHPCVLKVLVKGEASTNILCRLGEWKIF